MHDVLHDGVGLRALGTIPHWGAELAVRCFRRGGSGASDTLFADLVADDALFPPEWSKPQRRERLTRLVGARLEIDGRFLVRVGERQRRTRSLYEKVKSVVVEPGRHPEASSIPARPANAGYAGCVPIPAPLGAPRHEGPGLDLAVVVADLARRLAVLEARALPPGVQESVPPVSVAAAAPQPTAPPPAVGPFFDEDGRQVGEQEYWPRYPSVVDGPPPGRVFDPAWMTGLDTNEIDYVLRQDPDVRALLIAGNTDLAVEDRERAGVEWCRARIPETEAGFARVAAEVGYDMPELGPTRSRALTFVDCHDRVRKMYKEGCALARHVGADVRKDRSEMRTFSEWHALRVFTGWAVELLERCETALMLREEP